MNLDHIPTLETDEAFTFQDQIIVCKNLERRLTIEKQEHAETRKDYLCLARQLDGHDATECAANLAELKRNLTITREAMQKTIGLLYTQDATKEQAVLYDALRLTDPKQ